MFPLSRESVGVSGLDLSGVFGDGDETVPASPPMVPATAPPSVSATATASSISSLFDYGADSCQSLLCKQICSLHLCKLVFYLVLLAVRQRAHLKFEAIFRHLNRRQQSRSVTL